MTTDVSFLVPEADLLQLEQRLRAMNPSAKQYRTLQSKINVAHILGIEAFDLATKLEIDPGFLEEEDHDHDDDVTSLFFRETRPLDIDKVNDFLNEWLQDHGTDTFRYKGVLHIKGVDQRVVFQGIHMLFSSYADRIWKSNEVPLSEFVIIGRNLDETWFKEQFARCLAS